MMTDTIAAIATAVSEAGISIIRISGEEAIATAERVFRSKGKKSLMNAATHTIHYGHIYDGETPLDEVLVLLMRGPHSYTGEDTVEIDCHGGVFVTGRILETVLKNGARLAQPGEFTRRAFLNGRLDLSQAEAVGDLISSRNEYARKASFEQLKGSVRQTVTRIREKILYHIAFIESALDDPEHISLKGYPEQLKKDLEVLKTELQSLVNSFDDGRLCREGIRTVIVGKPNAGKSSLLNVLVGEERAIVTEVAGTTRDTLEEQIQIHGISLNVIDTAGIRDTEDKVERIGVERAIRSMEQADLVLYVVDASRPLNVDDEKIISMLAGRKVIVLLNKSDLVSVVSEEEMHRRLDQPVIAVSAKEETGIDCLEQTLKGMFFTGKLSFQDQVCITNIRHKRALEEALQALNQVSESISLGMPEDFYSIDLMAAYTASGEVIGEAVGEDLVNEIFSKFCMGK